MGRSRDAQDPRRRLLARALAAGFVGAGLAGREAAAQIPGRVPAKLSRDKSVYRLSGDVPVDGKNATPQTRVGGKSTIETGQDSEIVYTVGQSAFIQRAQSRVVLESNEPDSLILSGLRLLSGRILSVFAAGKTMQLRTTTAIIGIRGTGIYLESAPDETYVCTCYGIADVVSAQDPRSRRTVVARHHDQPLYVSRVAPAGSNIREAPVINHTDQELILIEALVGRTPPFDSPRNDYFGLPQNN